MSSDELFRLAKKIVNHKIEYKRSQIDVVSFAKEKGMEIIDIENDDGFRNIEYIETSFYKDYIKIEESILAYVDEVKMLIINCDEINSLLLDESSVEGLLFGEQVKKIKDNKLIQMLRYIYVHKDNPYFSSSKNVLFSKNKTILYAYASKKEDEEYRVPKSVKRITSFAFAYPTHLKKLYVPKGVQIDIDGISPSVQVIYYE